MTLTLIRSNDTTTTTTDEWATIDIGHTFEGSGFRAQRFSDTVRVTELEHAGKRGKTCIEVSADCWGASTGEVATVCMHVRKATTFEAAVQLLTTWAETRTKEGPQVRVYERTRKAFEVAPASFTTIRMFNEGMSLRVDWDGFCVSDRTDKYNEPTTIPGRGSSFAAAAKARKLVAKLGTEAIESMTYHEVVRAFSAAGVSTHSYCACD